MSIEAPSPSHRLLFDLRAYGEPDGDADLLVTAAPRYLETLRALEPAVPASERFQGRVAFVSSRCIAHRDLWVEVSRSCKV